jgi:amidase
MPEDTPLAACWVPDSVSLQATGHGPLDNVTVAVKDMISVAGHVSSFGHPRWRATHAPGAENAPVLSGLLAAGASVTGLAKLDQLAYSLIGNAGEGVAPLNSLYPGRFTGGSSSGPAAAVAAGLAEAGLGTDTAGSIRVPAAACGLFGFRPTHGLVSTRGVLPLAPSFDAVGVLARRAALLGQVMQVLLASSGAARGPMTPRTVCVPSDCLARVSPELSAAVQATAQAIAEACGCAVSECSLSSFSNEAVADLFARIQGREVWHTHGSWLSGNSQFLAPDVQSRVRRAEALSRAGPDQADEQAWRSYPPRLGEVLPADSVAVLPVIADLPPLRGASPEELLAFRAGALRFTAPASLAGRPELVVPVHHRSSGLRFGVGILGPESSDLALLRIARQICPEDAALGV